MDETQQGLRGGFCLDGFWHECRELFGDVVGPWYVAAVSKQATEQIAEKSIRESTKESTAEELMSMPVTPVDPDRRALSADADVNEDANKLGLRAALTKLGLGALAFLSKPFVELGALAMLAKDTVIQAVRPPYRWRLFIQSMEFIGVGSIFIVGLTGFFVGAVLGLQLVDGFRDVGLENQTGSVIGFALSREIAPVFSALMVSSRAGSAMTTELGSMRVTHQIDALVTMAVNPVQYLVVPRVLAGVIMMPVLTVMCNVVGMCGAWLVATRLLGLDSGIFLERMRWLVDWDDVQLGLIKSVVFGFTVSLIACRQGFYASGGAAGVGQATNRSVVHNAIAILLLDYVVTSVVLGQGMF